MADDGLKTSVKNQQDTSMLIVIRYTNTINCLIIAFLIVYLISGVVFSVATSIHRDLIHYSNSQGCLSCDVRQSHTGLLRGARTRCFRVSCVY